LRAPPCPPSDRSEAPQAARERHARAVVPRAERKPEIQRLFYSSLSIGGLRQMF
jgi:hypothetical protein